MPSSSASTHQLGRRFWASVRDSIDTWAWNVPTAAARRRGRRSLVGIGIAQSVFAANAASAAAAEVSSRSRGAAKRSFSFLAGRRLFGPTSTSISTPTSSLMSYSTSFSLRASANARISPNHVRRSCTSGGLLLIGLSSPSTPPATVVATCTAAADSALSCTSTHKSNIGRIMRHTFRQDQSPRQQISWMSSPFGLPAARSKSTCSRAWKAETRRYKSTSRWSNSSNSRTRNDSLEKNSFRRRQSSNSNNGKHAQPGHEPKPVPAEHKAAAAYNASQRPPQQQHPSHSQQPQSNPPQSQQPHLPSGHENDPETIASSMSKYLQTHMPKIPHRPTKEELLAAANGFSQRLKVRLKWLTIRSMRPWNADEWGAFLSWFMLGHIVWILVGTTTFMSIVILTINTVFAQEKLAKWVGDYLTQSAGVTVIFESAIVPKWKNGVITFRNVFVSRRPGQIKSSVTKGSPSSAAAIAAARHTHDQDMEQEDAAALDEEVVDDGNYTQFDVTINSVDVTLSFYKWWNGKGPLKDVEVRGVRGVIDRTHVKWGPGPFDPFSYRHEHVPGDFEIERFKLEDLMVTVHQPNGFRPFSASIFSCELPQFRKHYMFYDFLCANHVSGSFDGSLFTIHPRQVQHSTVIPGVVDNSHNNINNPVVEPMSPEAALAWKKFSRLRIDALKIDHLNRGDPGPFGWIYEGNVDIVADVMLPADPDEGITRVVTDFYDKMEEAVTSNRYIRILDGNYGSRRDKNKSEAEGDDEEADDVGNKTSFAANPVAAAAAVAPVPTTIMPPTPVPTASEPIPQYVVMDLRLHLNDIRAAVPFFPATSALGQTRAQSYVNAALIRPIVAYMNAKRTYIPISCRVVKHLSDFDGSWTIYDCGLMDDMSAEVYAAFAHDVEDQQSRVRRLKKVGFWTLSMVVHALLAGVAGDLM